MAPTIAINNMTPPIIRISEFPVYKAVPIALVVSPCHKLISLPEPSYMVSDILRIIPIPAINAIAP